MIFFHKPTSGVTVVALNVKADILWLADGRIMFNLFFEASLFGIEIKTKEK